MPAIDPAIASAVAAKEAAVRSQIALAVAGKHLKVMEQQGTAVAELLEAVVSMGRALGRGTQFDAVT